AQCVNNLKQLALAAHNYESGQRSFPMGNRYIDNTSFFSQSACSSSSWFGHSAFNLMFPYIEGNAQYNALNFSQRANSITNTTTTSSSVATFKCPSDLEAPPSALTINGVSVSPTYSQSSYGMSRGTQENIYANWATTSFPDPNAEQAGKCNAA